MSNLFAITALIIESSLGRLSLPLAPEMPVLVDTDNVHPGSLRHRLSNLISILEQIGPPTTLEDGCRRPDPCRETCNTGRTDAFDCCSCRLARPSCHDGSGRSAGRLNITSSCGILRRQSVLDEQVLWRAASGRCRVRTEHSDVSRPMPRRGVHLQDPIPTGVRCAAGA